jgi:hypothetical protein
MLNANLKMAIDLSFRKRSASGEHRDLIVNIGFDRQFSNYFDTLTDGNRPLWVWGMNFAAEKRFMKS